VDACASGFDVVKTNLCRSIDQHPVRFQYDNSFASTWRFVSGVVLSAADDSPPFVAYRNRGIYLTGHNALQLTNYRMHFSFTFDIWARFKAAGALFTVGTEVCV
jgi:hypothetical protein